ncbi:PucR family transcriptional regulator [Mycobacterium aquaticum]|uniref:PucR protein n=1 Tax=Mycobacterium aquaticum TaxID=1927124 RepID=A0A1X0AAB3_9MYCO|nr:helix-turn-helix domain-containing protein [Mycobacterium aquaticum]ORA26983.1 PucR protein [Mycobacterium aquaticum]
MGEGQVHIAELGLDAASVLRITAVFDHLIESKAGADRMLATAAAIAGCAVGARWVSGEVLRCDAEGRMPPTRHVPDAVSGVDPEVWLERDGAGYPLDPVLLDRLRHALRVRAAGAVALHIDDPALLEVVLSAKEYREERARAIRLLGLDENRPVCVLAVSAASPPAALRIITDQLGDRSVRSVTIGSAIAVLCQGALDTRDLAEALEAAIVTAFPAPLTTESDRGPWVGIGSCTGVFAAATSWHQALRALRFASSTGFGRRAIAYDRLSALELLAELPREQVLQNPDVARINKFAATPAGASAIDTFEAFCVFGSLRAAAAELHVHHSTVAARIAAVEEEMGWHLDDPIDRFLATLTLMVRRITLSSSELGDPDVI